MVTRSQVTCKTIELIKVLIRYKDNNSVDKICIWNFPPFWEIPIVLSCNVIIFIHGFRNRNQ